MVVYFLLRLTTSFRMAIPVCRSSKLNPHRTNPNSSDRAASNAAKSLAVARTHRLIALELLNCGF
jgi:hypothetical protein